MAENDAVFKVLTGLVEVLATSGLESDDRLFALELAWLSMASNARTAAIAFPGGFPAQQARQVERLAKISALVSGATPDLELERLWQEGDVEGYVARIRTLMGGD